MHAYVINLARSPDRRVHIVAELQRTGLTYEFVDAVDGRNLDLDDTALIDPVLIARYAFPAGTAGCSLSHLTTFKKIVEDGLDRALILEDDIALPADLNELVEDIAEHMTGAEVALLNYASCPPGPLRISSHGAIQLSSSRQFALPIDLRQLVNSGAYVITREACERAIEGLLPIRAAADDWHFFFDQGFFDRIRCVLPQPVPKSPQFESTIGLYSLGNGLKARLVGPLVRHKIPGLHQALTYRRQRIMRHWDRAEMVDQPFVEKPSRLG